MRSVTWTGVLADYSDADLARAAAFDAKRLALRVEGSTLHVFVVVHGRGQVSAETIAAKMGLEKAIWTAASCQPSDWAAVTKTHKVSPCDRCVS
mmetsp:Transcript_26610/g.60178  ORF Transcript_26610/g.60178 Transcript_26610/m.60178 type:complete len:94 (+) Transcript_26610:268-549(+)